MNSILAEDMFSFVVSFPIFYCKWFLLGTNQNAGIISDFKMDAINQNGYN